MKVKKYIVDLIVLGLMIYYHGKLGYVQHDKAVFLGLLFLAGKYFISFFVKGAKYDVSQVIVNDDNFAHSGNIYECGDYYVISLGDIPYLDVKATEGHLIAHKDSYFNIGSQIACYGTVYNTPLEQLPPDIKRFVQTHNLRGPFKFIPFSDKDINELKEYAKSKNIRDISRNGIISYILDINQHNDLLDKLLQGKTEAINREVARASNMVHSLNPRPAWLNKIMGGND